MNSKVSQLPAPSSKDKQSNEIKAPKHLTAASRKFYQRIAVDYVLEPHHLRLLQLLCEAWDRGQEARKILQAEGLTIDHEKLGKRPHPAVSIERDARTAVARLLRELNLSEEPEDSRPPPLRYGGR
jgi:P27 family predicted phage terminase small subunit